MKQFNLYQANLSSATQNGAGNQITLQLGFFDREMVGEKRCNRNTISDHGGPLV
jgi:hypothetical protein